MKRLLPLLAAAVMAASTAGYAASITSTASGGNWTVNSTWLNNSVPAANDDVTIVPGASVTVTANANARSITFPNSNSSRAVLTVNSGASLTLGQTITMQSAATMNTAALIQGGGTISCAGVNVGGTTMPTAPGSDYTATLDSEISNLVVSGNLSIKALWNAALAATNQGTFALGSGEVTVNAVTFATTPVAGPVLTMATGNQSGTLNLLANTAITVSGGSLISFIPNGTNATVLYSGNPQTVYGATYQNLTLAGAAKKTISGVTVNGILCMEGTTKATAAPIYGPNAILEYAGTSAQTNGPELTATLPALMISNIYGVTLTSSTTVGQELILAGGEFITGANKIFLDTNGSVSGGSSGSYVNGNVQKNFSAGTQSFMFPIGDTEFAPVSVLNLAVLAPGGIAASTTLGAPAQVGSSGILTNLDVNRYWVLTSPSGKFGSYSAGFNYPSGDLDAGANATGFGVSVLNGGVWSFASVSGIPTSNQTSISGESEFGTFVIGDTVVSPAANLAVTSINGGASPVVGGLFSITVQSDDTNGAPENVLVDTVVTLSVNSGSGILGGTLTGTIPAGSSSVTISGVTYSVAESGVQVAASGTSGQSLVSGISAAFAVSPAGQFITFSSPGNQTYGVAPITLTATASSGLPVSYSILSGPAMVSGNTLTLTGAGSVTIQASQSGNGNWTPATPVSQTISVGPITVTGNFTANNKVYDGTNTASIASLGLSGVINSDNVTLSAAGAAFGDKNVGNGKMVIASGLSLGGANSANYVLASTYATNAANISTATLTVTANNTNRTYGAANPTFTASYTGFVSGDDSSVLSGSPSLTTAATTSSSVAGSPYAVTAAQGTLSAANYSFNFVNGNLSVSAATLTVTANNTNRSYGAVNPAFTASYSGFVNGEDSGVLSGAPSLTTSATTSSSVAGSPYAITAAQGTLGAPNYSFNFVNGNLNVTAATLSVTANNTNQSYGAANPVFTATYSGFVNGEDASVLSGAPSLTTTATPSSSVAGSPYAIIAAQGTLSAANYSFNFVNGNLSVTPANLTVTANDTNRIYGTANPAFTASYSGFVNNENSTALSGAPSLTTTATASSSVGGSPYPITVAQGTLTAANYSFSFANGNLTITPATLMVTADNKSRSYGATNPVLTVTYSGFANGDGTNVLNGCPNLSTTADTNSTPGQYAIQTAAGTLSSTNYAFDLVDGTLTVSSLSASLTIVYVRALNAVVLDGTGASPNTTYHVVASTDLRNWSEIGTAQSTAGGTLSFTNNVSVPAQFYRVYGQ